MSRKKSLVCNFLLRRAANHIVQGTVSVCDCCSSSGLGAFLNEQDRSRIAPSGFDVMGTEGADVHPGLFCSAVHCPVFPGLRLSGWFPSGIVSDATYGAAIERDMISLAMRGLTMSPSTRVRLLRRCEVPLILLGMVHLVATSHIVALIRHSASTAAADQLASPMLLNHILVGVLLFLLGYITIYAAS
jgi:hypothetical protein